MADIIGNEKDNILFGTPDRDNIYGAAGDDILYGEAGDDFFDGGAGKDFVDGGSGSDQAFGGSGADTLYGNEGDDLLDGGSDNDTLLGGDGNDTLLGGDGNDVLDGQAGNNIMIGGAGDDSYTLTERGDSCKEAPNGGIDLVRSYRSLRLINQLEKLTLLGDRPVNGYGNSADNVLRGNISRNRLYGQGGNDYLYGQNGNDTLVGDRGNDQLLGGAGRDRLIGGEGADRFCFESSRQGRDQIVDFAVGSDTIGISRAGFGQDLSRGTLDSDQFHVGSSAGDSSDRFIYSSDRGALYFDPDGSGGSRQVQIASLASGLNFTHRNIVILP